MGNVTESLEQVRQIAALFERRLKVLEELAALDDQIDAMLKGPLGGQHPQEGDQGGGFRRQAGCRWIIPVAATPSPWLPLRPRKFTSKFGENLGRFGPGRVKNQQKRTCDFRRKSLSRKSAGNRT